jgi:hypothetical protein
MDVLLIKHPNIKGQNDSGWSLDALEMLVDGHPAGFLTMAVIPSVDIQRLYPEVWAHLEVYAAGLQNMDVESWRLSGSSMINSPRVDVSQAFSLHRELMKTLNEIPKFPMGLQPHKNVNRAEIDEIRLYYPESKDKRILRFPERSVSSDCVPHQDYRGLGLGALLYREGARWMAEKGCSLRESTMQSFEARLAWKRLANTLPADSIRQDIFWESWAQTAQEEKTPWMLDGNHIPEWKPNAISSMTIIDSVDYSPKAFGI